MLSKCYRFILPPLLISPLLVLPVQASPLTSTVTYNYVSDDFTSIELPQFGTRITGSVTFEGLSEGFTGQYATSSEFPNPGLTPRLTHFSFQAGSASNSSVDLALLANFEFVFNNGEITAFNVSVSDFVDSEGFLLNNLLNPESETISAVQFLSGIPRRNSAPTAGTFSRVSAVPLPAGLWLFASGLLGLGVFGSRKYS